MGALSKIISLFMSVVAAATFGTTTVASMPAAASSSATSAYQSDAPIIPAKDSTAAFNWAGYVADEENYTAVSATWVVPVVSKPSDNGADATWVGIGGVGTRDLIQAGTEALPGDHGNLVYAAWYEALPGDSKMAPLPVSPGDSITVNVHEDTLNNWIIDFKNNTSGQTIQKHVAYLSSHSSADWIEEMPVSPDTPITLDNFGSVRFMDAYTVVNGVKKTIQGANAHALRMDNGNREALALPSELGTDGASFRVVRTDSPAAPLQFVHYGRRNPESQIADAQNVAPVEAQGGDGWRIVEVRILGY